MIIHNEDIKELIAEIPDGHKHLRTTIVFRMVSESVFQEATQYRMATYRGRMNVN